MDQGRAFYGDKGGFSSHKYRVFQYMPLRRSSYDVLTKKITRQQGENMNKLSLLLATILVLSLAGCTKVGSEAWCADMKEKPKGDWSTNEAGDFAKHCVFK
jgi:Protein of unknown function (DUF3012)